MSKRISIEPIHVEGLDCYENIMISLLNWKVGHYTLSFVDSWSFHYDKSNNKNPGIIGDKIGPLYREIAKNMYKYYNFRVFMHMNTIEEDLLHIENELLEGNPVGIHIDPFYCHWQKDYNNNHGVHFCLLNGINEDGSFSCCETLPLISDITLPRKDLISGYKSCFVIKKKQCEIRDFDVAEIFTDCIERLGLYSKERNAFSDMRDFADYVENSLDIMKETEGYSYEWQIPLYSNIYKIHGGRVQFFELLKYMAQKKDDQGLKKLSEEFGSITIQWGIIRSLFYKLCFSKQSNLSSIADKIRKVASLEENFAYKIDEYLKNGCLVQENLNLKGEHHTSLVFIDLDEYFNNKAFGYSAEGFTGLGDYFLTEGLPSGDVWTVNNVQFKFPDVTKGQFDNISCQGQFIKFPKKRYTCINLLCCAEWGNFIENFTVYYEDGTTENLELTFTDWFLDPFFGETVAWKGHFLEKGNADNKRTGRIFALSCKFNVSEKTVEGIRLPNCRNIHIFAITLNEI